MAATDINTMKDMARWDPDSRDRLRQAAIDLYGERGFENTTVAEIAKRAGLTERTFFRHFADKREVLFSGSETLQERLVRKVVEAPASLAPLDAVALGLEAIGEVLPERAETSRRRQTIITANAELRERELIKLASLSEALAGAQRGRGVAAAAAGLLAEVGIAVFKTAFGRWIAEGEERDFAQVARESIGELKMLTGRVP
jgi:AcrR family transcriptional regulator